MKTNIFLIILFSLSLSGAIAPGLSHHHASRLQERSDVLVPDVILLEPSSSSIKTEEPEVRIKALIKSRDPLTAVIVRLNGQPVHKELIEGLRYVLDIPVLLKSERNSIEVIAYNKKVPSKPASATVIYRPSAQSKPNLAVLAIGVSQSKGSTYAAADAEAFAKIMKAQEFPGGLFDDVDARALVNEEATREDILKGLRWLSDHRKSPKDILILFISGTILTDYRDSSSYFLTTQHKPKIELGAYNVELGSIWEFLKAADGETLLFANADFSSSGGDYVLKKFLGYDEKGVTTYFSSSGNPLLYVDSVSGHSAFVTALLEGLSGKADLHVLDTGKDDIIDTHELQTWLSSRVAQLTAGKQFPAIQVGPRPVAIFKVRRTP